MHRTNQILLAAAAAILMTSACGPGSQTAGIEGTGAPAPVTATGPVTGFGSIFVNGVEFTTTAAQIQIDGQPGTESQLAIGEIVTVTGTLNANNTTGAAAQVTFRGNVQGPVALVDVATNTFVELGQTVLVNANTVFDPSIQPQQISGIKTGDAYEVSGFPDSSGHIIASRVQVAATNSALRVEGALQGLNTSTTAFQINALSVDYSAATVHGSLADGSLVNVQGTSLNASGTLLATDVAVLPPPGGASGSRGEVEGVITSFNSASDFMVNGVHVTTNANTLFELNGITLGVDVRVEVEGSYDSTGTLVATSVEAGDT
jgi:hypothetical protein